MPFVIERDTPTREGCCKFLKICYTYGILDRKVFFMKRFFALILALCLCLGLCACGRGEPATEPETTISNEPPAATITDHPLLEKTYGEWLLTEKDRPEDYPFANVVINQDGTVVVDGENLVWRIDEMYTSEKALALYFYRGSEKIVGIQYDEAGWLCPLTADGAIYPSAYINRATATPEQLRAVEPDRYALPLICGTWLLTREKEGMPLEVVLQEDYTCTLDGVRYTWSMETQNGWNFDIYILDGGTTLHTGTLLVASVYAGESQLSLGNANYVNPKFYDIVEITAENWLDYFEVVPSWSWVENAFGETEEMGWYGFRFKLKEEYYPQLSRVANNGDLISRNAMEIAFSVDKQLCDVDLENQTFTPREGAVSYVERYTDMYRLAFASDTFDTGLYTWHTNSESIAHVYDLELVRVECSLYFIKGEYYQPEA